jgi:hypothetical protein
MWSAWGVFVLLLAALYLYRSSLERDEDGQIFLDESFDHEKNAQAAIVDKVNKVQPLVRMATGLVAVSTLFVIGFYIVDFVRQFK